MDVGKRINQMRIDRNMKLYTLSKSAGISQTHLQKIESGRTNPNTETLTKLTQALDCTLSEFFNEDPTHFYLTEDEKHLLSSYRRLALRQKPHVTDLVDSILEANKEFANTKPEK